MCHPPEKKAEGENEEDVSPLDVEHGVEEVGDVAPLPLRHPTPLRVDDALPPQSQCQRLNLTAHFLLL